MYYLQEVYIIDIYISPSVYLNIDMQISCIIDKRKLIRILFFIFFIVFCALRPNLAAAVASTSTSAEQAVASFSVFNAATPTENVRPLSLTRAAAASVALPVMLFAYLLCSLLLLLLVLQPYLFAHSQHSN